MLELVDKGPVYPALPQLAKYRRKFRHGLHGSEGIHEYGMAVKAAFRSLQRQELAREVPTFRSNSASGTFHNDPKKIKEAIYKQNIARMSVKEQRDDEWVKQAYEEAMKEKRERASKPEVKKPVIKAAAKKPSAPMMKKPQIVFKQDKPGEIRAFHGRKEIAVLVPVDTKRLKATIKLGKTPITRMFGSLLFAKLDLMKRLEA